MENGESMGHWKRWTPQNTFFEEKVAFVLLKWHWQEKNIGREVFFASKYRKGIDLQQPLPISDL